MSDRHVLPLFLVWGLAAGIASARPLEKSETFQRTFPVSGETVIKKLVVDNVWGGIRIEGSGGDRIEIRVKKTIEARSADHQARAEKEVRLDIHTEGDSLELYVDGPFRCFRSRGIRWRGEDREGYRVRYDFEISAPRHIALVLKTVLDGDIRVRNIDARFEADNVNGDVVMEGLGGSGHAYSVNGDVTLNFSRNPGAECDFGALNGEVRLYFPEALSADFFLKTFNGDVYTDFPVKSLPPVPFSSVTADGMKVYKAGHRCAVRAGNGGPPIHLDGFNGDMFILKQ